MSALGKAAAGIVAGAGVGITLVAAPFVSPAFRRLCLPYVPATPAQIANLRETLEVEPLF